MTITVDPAVTLHDNLTVELGVHNGMTKTVIRVRKNGTIKFKNKHNTSALTITATPTVPPSPAPFLVPGIGGAQMQFTVEAGDDLTVTISPEYNVGDQFSYKAQVGDSTPEDPIVIVDRR